MVFRSLASRALLHAALLLGAVPAVAATFSFDALAPTNAAVPFSITADGVTASLTSPAGAGAFVAEDGSAFTTLGTSVLADANFVPETLDIGFSQSVAGLSLPFATNDSGVPTALVLTAAQNGARVGSTTAAGTVAASGLPEGALSLTGRAFNAVQITDADPGNAGFAIGALTVQAVPEPSAFLVLASGLIGLVARRRRASTPSPGRTR